MHLEVNIIVTAGLSNKKLITKLQGLMYCRLVKKIYLVRKIPLESNNNKLVNINPPNYIKKSMILFELWRLYIFFKITSSQKIDMLYAIQLIPHSFHTYIVSIILKKPMVLSVIGDDVHIYLKKQFIKPILKKIIKKASFITILGPQSEKLIYNTGFSEQRIIKILNHIDENQYVRNDNKKTNWELLFTGDLVSIKSLDTLIEAFAIVQVELPDTRLCIVGDGPEKNKLQTLAKNLGVADGIDFIRKTDNICEYINQSKVLIMTSKSEALPASAIEAAFCGLPTILPNVGDISGLFQHNINSLIFSPGNMDELVSCILKLLKDKTFYSKLSYGALQLKDEYIRQWNVKQQPLYWEKIIKSL